MVEAFSVAAGMVGAADAAVVAGAVVVAAATGLNAAWERWEVPVVGQTIPPGIRDTIRKAQSVRASQMRADPVAPAYPRRR